MYAKALLISCIKKRPIALFFEENLDIKIGLSKFRSLRSSHTLLRRDVSHNVCLVKTMNISDFLEALKDKIQFRAQIFNDWENDAENETCMHGECNSCPMLDGIFTNYDLLNG